MSVLDSTPADHTLRRLSSIVHTLNTVAHTLDDIDNDPDVDFRWELLVLAENLMDIAGYVTYRSRDIAWGPEPIPFDPETGSPDDGQGYLL